MAIDNENVIDVISTNEQRNEVVLTIADHLDWELKMEHLLKLHNKINAYLGFIESGEVYEKYKTPHDKKLVIFVAGKYDLPDDKDVQGFYSRAGEIVKQLNVTLKFEKIPTLV